MPTPAARVCAFTLIELLIVVAIIAILAAIAVPNFLEAQVRAKVSRAKSDLRTLATALEAYRVDNNDYPYITDGAGGTMGEWTMPAGIPPNRTGPGGLTTPIAYISSALDDPFVFDHRGDGTGQMARGRQWLRYERLGFGYNENGTPYNDNGSGMRGVRVCVDGNGGLLGTAPDFNTTDPSLIPVRYVLFSVGPDRTHRVYNVDGSILVRSRFSIYARYDPTNGTVSNGSVLRFPDGLSFP
ncbi:MAG: prepilin-type N-terminal cleavage/methylation domain-containing protein [Candidatus Sumerlaeia bacterium]|nr:prepilin-type N-terminal cleavage/methylation domain-containing protein [Candidatus Sumerlaeia bacterium]